MLFKQNAVACGLVLPFLGLLAFPGATAGLFTSNYLPHGSSFFAHPALLWTNVAADVLLAASYFAIFAALLWVCRQLRRAPEVKPHLWVLGSFAAFILACGFTHMIEVVTIWWPVYRLSAASKTLCATVSILASFLFVRKISDLTASMGGIFELLSTISKQREELRKSEYLLERTGRIAGIGSWELDLERDEVTWSAETHRIHGAAPGYKPNLQEGIRMYAPEARPTIIAAVLTAAAGGVGWDLELPLIRMDGARIMVRSVGEVDSRDGKAVRLLGAFQDITEQVAAREALRKANERVAVATDCGNIGIFDWDIKKDLYTADQCLHRLYGLDHPGYSTPLQYWAASMHPEDRQEVMGALEDAIADRRPYDTEFRVVWHDGSVHHLRATARVTRDEFGTPMHMIGVNWDVTEARRLTAELAEQHDLLRVTLQSIGDGVITTDLDRNVSWLNPVAERMTGWSILEACGKPLLRIFNTINAETREPVDNPLANFVAQGNVVGMARETILISRNGAEFGIENQAAPIRDGDGELIGNILVFRDVTEQRRLAAETEHVTRLQLELKTKDEFLSHVSHELRSPLTSIYSFTSIISDGLAGETTAEQEEYLQIILKNVVQLQSMIEDLLTVTQASEGKLSIELQRVEPRSAIDDALHTLSSAASTKGINLTAAEVSGLSPVFADPTRLRQILIILLDNAIKFTPQGGGVTVSISDTGDSSILFQVRDTGCGIPEEKRALVFENLYQITGPAPPDTSQMGRIGLGLGLHIARNLVTRQGGQIWVSSAPDGGSVFNFTLPVYLESCFTLAEEPDHPRRRKTDQPSSERSTLAPAA